MALRFKKSRMNIFIKKLSYDTTESTLRTAFEKFGTVANCNIVMDTVARKSKGFGFVEMLDDTEANAAILALNNSKLDGRAITAKEVQPKQESTEVDVVDTNDRRSSDRRGSHRGSRNTGYNRKK